MEFKHILVPIDFSEFSDKAVEFALHLAARYQAKIALAHVVVMYPDDIDEETRFQEYQEFINKREARVQEQIQSRQDRAASRKIPVDSVLLRGFSPADALLEYIKEKKFDLVIMGTHGRTGLKHFIQGSVAEKMLRLAPIPVLAGLFIALSGNMTSGK
jgi:nucleotide-binding universal stress UspA family protein